MDRVLGSILTYTASAAASPGEGAIYLSVYGFGFALPLLVTAAFAELGMRVIGRISPYLPRIEKGIGIVLLFIAGMLALDVFQATSYSENGEPSDTAESIILEHKSGLPVMVEFYEQTGFLPAGLLNSLGRTGWSVRAPWTQGSDGHRD